MASEIFHLKIHIYSVPIVCLALFMCCWQSKADIDCGEKPTRCPVWLQRKNGCYCPNGYRVKLHCERGKWQYLPCGAPTTIPVQTTQLTTIPTPQCPELPEIIYGKIVYSDGRSRLPHTNATYKCDDGAFIDQSSVIRYCKSNGQWRGKKPEASMCYCDAPRPMGKLQISLHPPYQKKSGFYALKTIATYYCKDADRKIQIVVSTCEFNHGQGGVWIQKPSQPGFEKCQSSTPPTIGVPKSKGTKPTLHHTDERTVIIVSGTTGAILGALIILVVIVSCQRRIHYHRMRRARIRHRQDQDAFTAFITYHRDARLLLPSYDEAINQQEQGQPPSFEEALGHYEEPTLPPDHTPTGDGRTSDTQTSSAPPGSETHNPPETSTSAENHSDTVPILDSQSSPTSENSRLFRSLRALFGGRTFRPDAIYCRFVPEEDGESETRTSTRTAVNESPDDGSADVELAEVLTQAGLC